MRTMLIGAATVLVAAILTGCGAINKGTAFAGEFEPLLQDRELVSSARVIGSDNLPWAGDASVTVNLVPDLSDADMVEEIWEITALEVDNHVGYTLQVLFPSPMDGGGTATAGLSLRVPEPAPDEQALRDDIREQVGLARDLAALGAGETVAAPGRWSSRFDTEADAVVVALGICANDDLASSIEALTIRGVASDGGTNRVKLGEAFDCDWVPDVNDLIEVADSLGQVELAEASFQLERPPELRLTFASPGPADLSGLAGLAEDLGVALVVL